MMNLHPTPNAAYLLLILAVTVWLHLLYVRIFPDVSPHAAWLIQLSAVGHAGLLFALYSACCLAIGRFLKERFRDLILGALLTLFPVMLCLDYVVFTKVNLHLLRWVIHCVLAKAGPHSLAMRFKTAGIDLIECSLAALLILVVLALGMFFYRLTAAASHRWLGLFRTSHFLAILISSMALITSEQLLSPKLTSFQETRKKSTDLPFYLLYSATRAHSSLPSP